MFEDYDAGVPYPHIYKGGHGHPIDVRSLRSQIGVLSLILYGEGPLFTDYLMNPHASSECAAFVIDTEIVPRLLHITTIARTMMYHLQCSGGAPYVDGDHNRPCGYIDHSDERRNLFLKDSCDKIIHANQIRYDPLKPSIKRDGSREFYGSPMVYASGELRKRSWRVGIQCNEFLAATTGLLQKYEASSALEPLYPEAGRLDRP